MEYANIAKNKNDLYHSFQIIIPAEIYYSSEIKIK
jgi:hypothetical protein